MNLNRINAEVRGIFTNLSREFHNLLDEIERIKLTVGPEHHAGINEAVCSAVEQKLTPPPVAADDGLARAVAAVQERQFEGTPAPEPTPDVPGHLAPLAEGALPEPKADGIDYGLPLVAGVASESPAPAAPVLPEETAPVSTSEPAPAPVEAPAPDPAPASLLA